MSATTFIRAAELLEIDANALRQCHNVDPLNPDWEDEPEAREAHDEARAIAGQLRQIAGVVQTLQSDLAREKDRADYAWRNTNTIEKSRQEEMAKRDELLAALERLLYCVEPDANQKWAEGTEVEQARDAIAKVRP